jgi:uncharacterized membrane protein YbhN (UPF0104 family)
MVSPLPARQLLSRVLPVVAVAGSAALIAFLPRIVGMSWSAIVDVLGGLSLLTLGALTVLWMTGLLVHTVVLTAALPGLSSRRALLLNMSGSAVSNLVPFGGTAGMGLGYVMARSWRVSSASFASFTAISNVWNVLGKLLVGSALLGGAIIFDLSLPAGLNVVVAVGALLMLAVVLGVIGVISSARLAGVVGGAIDRAAVAVLPHAKVQGGVGAQTWIVEIRHECAEAVSNGWIRLTFGVLGYMLLQAALLAACLIAVGVHAPWSALAVAFGVERLLTVLPFTPGGSGFAELGSVGVLVAMGVDPVLAASGVLLYRLFTFLLEIPVGGLSALVWLRQHRLSVREQVPA